MSRKSGRRVATAAAESPQNPTADGSVLAADAEVLRLGRLRLTARQAEIGALALTITLAAILHLANLGDHYLWQDEAQTALIAKTVLSDGVPRGYDGKNSFSQEAGHDCGPAPGYIWRLHAWLQFYLLAGFFGVLGTSTLVARLPFALVGLASVPLGYWFARMLWQSRRAAVLSAILLGTCVPFLLLSRQCRYYSLSAFFSLLGLLAYQQMIERKRWAAPLFVVAAVLLFHSHYPCWVVLLATVLAHALAFHRDRFVVVALSSFLTILLNVPWLIWMWPTVASQSETKSSFFRPFYFARDYTLETFQHVFSPVLIGLLVVVMIAAALRAKRFPAPGPATRRGAILLLMFVAFNTILFSAVTRVHYFRYLAPTIPVLCVLAGRIVDAAMRLHPALGIAGLAAILCLSPMADFLYEITHHYRGPIEGIVKYLNEHGKPDDVVVITYDDLPVKFYTPMRVVGAFTGEDLSPARTARWIIIRQNPVGDADLAAGQFLLTHLQDPVYRQISLDYPDLPWDNRENPRNHLYRSQTGGPQVQIFERAGP